MKKIFLILTVAFMSILAGCVQNSEPVETPGPLSDFEYSENQNGSITITDYLGTDTDIVIPAEIDGKTVTQIGWEAFAYNEDIVSVEIPDSVTVIDTDAFSSCTSLSSVSLSQNLESIEDAAFAGCTKLTAISLPPSLNYIGYSVFMNCTELSKIVLPEALTYLGIQSFQGCTSLRYIKIPAKIKEIDFATFKDSGLEILELEDGLEKIGREAFKNTKIKTVILPKTITELGDSAFYNCTNLESIALNEGLSTISDGALGGQSKMMEITIPASVAKMSEGAFWNCTTLKAVKFEGNAPEDYRTDLIYAGGPEQNFSYSVYYHRGAIGFTSPEWYGYLTEIW